jgi:hypothetical protein
MNAKLTFAAVMFATTATAFAQQHVAPDTNSVPTNARFETVQGIDAANAAETSSDAVHDGTYPVSSSQVSAKTREQVRAEVAETSADAAHDGTYPVSSSQASAKTREQVRAELAEYNNKTSRGYLYNYYIGS